MVGRPEARRPIGKRRRRWEDNIKMDLRDGCMDWIDLAQDWSRWRALVNAVMNLWVPQHFLYYWGPVRFSGRTECM